MSSKPSEPEVTPGYANYVLGLLLVVYIFNFIDRQILGILLEPIKAELQASDTAMGVLAGLAFAVFYTFAGIPIARWADRGSRRTIIALGLAVWSAMTAACGLARSFPQLALARVGVGIGEAAGSPPAHSLISDYFPPERRGRALSIYAAGVYVGVMIAFLGGGYIYQWFGWRMAFFVVGLPGLVLAFLVRFTIRELPRGFSEARATSTEQQVPFWDVVRFLLGQRTFVLMTLAGAVQSLSGYGVLSWGPAFYIRVFGMEVTDVGFWLGLIVGLGGSAGAYLGGLIADRFGQHDPRAYAYLCGTVCLLGVPPGIVFALAGGQAASFVWFVPFYMLGAMYVGPMLSMCQGLVSLQMRATASAVLLFVLNLVGLGAGPTMIGYFNDVLTPTYGNDAIRYSFAAVIACGLISGTLFLLASRTLKQDLERAAAG